MQWNLSDRAAEILYRTRGGLEVVRTTRPIEAEPALAELTAALDQRRGALFSSGIEYPGRYSRFDFGFVDPPLLLETAAGTVRVAIYTYNNTLTQVMPLSSNLSAAIAATNAVDLSTDGGGTNITYSLNSLNAILPTPGAGMNAGSPKGAVLLFTDAVQDHEKFTLATGVWANDPNWVPYSPSVYNMWDYQPIDPGGCAPIKAKGYAMLVLNAQYIITSTDLAEQSRYGDIKNIVLPAVDSNIASCSTGAGYYYSANSPTQIMSAVTSMFASAANNYARLSR